MKVEKIEKYICEICRKRYDTKEEALFCEKEDKSEKERKKLTEFEIKDEHLKLLKEMNIRWDDCEFGAPAVDSKRPYGNSNGVDDVARVIGYKKTKDTIEFDEEYAKDFVDINEYLEDSDWTQKAYDYLYNIHKDMEIVLQIVLSSLSFKKGIYIRDSEYSKWRFKNMQNKINARCCL